MPNGRGMAKWRGITMEGGLCQGNIMLRGISQGRMARGVVPNVMLNGPVEINSLICH